MIKSLQIKQSKTFLVIFLEFTPDPSFVIIAVFISNSNLGHKNLYFFVVALFFNLIKAA